MKKIYITFLVCGVSAMTYSQITILSTNYNGVIGETFDIETTAWMPEGASGASQTWDFSTMVSTGSDVLTYGTANTSFPATNIAQNTNGGSTFISQSSSGQYIHGLDAGGTIITYSNPMTFLEFPLSMSSMGTDSHACSFTSGGFPFSRAGTSSWQVDGWGSVITPNGTYNNVLRVKINQDYVDTYFGGTINYAVEIYHWLSAGIHYPVASITSVVTDFGSNKYGSYYSGAASVDELNITELSVYPNPINDNLFFTTDKGKFESIVITDLSGKVSLSSNQNTSNGSVNISALKSGIYFVTLNLVGGDKSTTKRIVKI